jgi:hypothetical protein
MGLVKHIGIVILGIVGLFFVVGYTGLNRIGTMLYKYIHHR